MRWNRESACRCRARLVAPDTARWAVSKVARARSVSCLDAAIAAPPGSTIRRKLRASSQSLRWAAVERSAVRADGPWGFMVTTVPPPRPRLVSTRPAVRRAAIASRRVARETSSRSASSRSGGRALPNGYTPSRMAVASCSTQASKAW